MGIGSSKQSISEDSFLGSFVDEKPLQQSNEQILAQLTAYNWMPAVTKQREMELEERIAPNLKKYLLNDEKSRNFSRILSIAIELLEVLNSQRSTDDEETKEVAAKREEREKALLNVIQIIRYCSKIMIENMTEEEFIERCSKPDEVNANGVEFLPRNSSIVVGFIIEIIRFVLRKEKETAESYFLLYECISTMIALFSGSLFKLTPATSSLILACFMKDTRAEDLSTPFVRALLQFYIDGEKLPADYATEGGSLIFGLASGIWNMFGGGWWLGGGNVEGKGSFIAG